MLLRKRYVKHPSALPSYRSLTAQHLFINNVSQNLLHIFDNEGKKLSLDKLLRNNPTTWQPALSNELGRLSQGIKSIIGNDTLEFIPYSQVPKD